MKRRKRSVKTDVAAENHPALVLLRKAVANTKRQPSNIPSLKIVDKRIKNPKGAPIRYPDKLIKKVVDAWGTKEWRGKKDELAKAIGHNLKARDIGLILDAARARKKRLSI